MDYGLMSGMSPANTTMMGNEIGNTPNYLLRPQYQSIDNTTFSTNPTGADQGNWMDKFGGLEGMSAGIGALSGAVNAGTSIWGMIEGKKNFDDMMKLRLADSEASRSTALWNMQRQMDKDKRYGRGVSDEMQGRYDALKGQKLG